MRFWAAHLLLFGQVFHKMDIHRFYSTHLPQLLFKLLPPTERRTPRRLPKRRCEVALIGEAATQPNLRKLQLWPPQKILRTVDAFLKDETVRRLPRRPTEH